MRVLIITDAWAPQINGVVRTIALARATLKIGMANIVYNIHRLLYLKRAVAT